MSRIAADSYSNVDGSRAILDRLSLYVFGFISLFLLWGLASFFVANPVFLPSPVLVLQVLYKQFSNGDLAHDIIVSVVRVLTGFFIGVGVAFPLGIAVGLNRTLFNAAEPIVEFFRAIPPYAMIPFALLAWGIGDFAQIFVLAYASFFPIVVNTIAAVQSVPGRLVEAAQTLGADSRFLVRHVVVPAAVPQVLVGLRLGFGRLIALIAAEMVGPDGFGRSGCARNSGYADGCWRNAGDRIDRLHFESGPLGNRAVEQEMKLVAYAGTMSVLTCW